MKIILFILIHLALIPSVAVAKEYKLISEHLTEVVKEMKLNRGLNPRGEVCYVTVKHNPSRFKNFELIISNKNKIQQTVYALYDELHMGGAGDCPAYLTNEADEIYVMNDFGLGGIGCFSHFKKANYGRLHLYLYDKDIDIIIEDKWGKIEYAQCKISI